MKTIDLKDYIENGFVNVKVNGVVYKVNVRKLFEKVGYFFVNTIYRDIDPVAKCEDCEFFADCNQVNMAVVGMLIKNCNAFPKLVLKVE